MDILFYGSHYWDRGPWFRKQFFAKYLSERNHRVFYIENSVSMIKWRPNSKNRFLKTQISNPENNLYVITPSAFFPFPHNYFMRKLYNKKLWRDIQAIFKDYNIKEYIIWFNILCFSTVLPIIKHKMVIFDLSDDVPFFYKLSNQEIRYQTYMKFLRTSYENAHIPIVSAHKIKEKYQQLTKKEIIVIPNGHNFPAFQSIDPDVPDELVNIPRPIIGFIGTLFMFTDDELLEHIISKRNNYSYVFVGKIQKEFPVDRIAKYSNVYILGEKKKDEVGKYINSFDICINPFKKHEVNDSVSPLKVYEYIAFRKPIVSGPMYSLQQEKISRYINFCMNQVEFLEQIDQIVESGNYYNDIPEGILLQYRWDKLFAKLISLIRTKHNFNL